jgi:hypothetical protein
MIVKKQGINSGKRLNILIIPISLKANIFKGLIKMKHTTENYKRTIHHIRGFGFNPEKIRKIDFLQSVEDKTTPIEAAEELVHFYYNDTP